MNFMKMKEKTIARKTTQTVVISCVLVGLISLVTGIGIYSTQLLQQYVRRAFDTAYHAYMSITHGADPEPIAKEIMRIYNGLTAEEKEMTGTEEYRQFFSGIDTSTPDEQGGEWNRLNNMLRNFIMDADDIYFAMFDEENDALVYFIDSVETDYFYPGDWETVSPERIRNCLDWDGEGMLYDFVQSDTHGMYCAAAYPVRNDAGELYGFVFVELKANSLFRAVARYILYVSLGIALLTALIAWLARMQIKNTVVDPIESITNAAKEYVKKSGADHEKSFFGDLHIETDDELESLSHIMAEMEKTIARHEKQIRKIVSKEERLNAELDMAKQIQQGMLPQEFPPFPDRKEFDVHAAIEPARVVGGDFYDFFLIDDDHLYLAIADVSGKSIPAALFMMMSQVIIKSYALYDISPAEILEKANEALYSNNKMQMFVTVWIGILEISTGKIIAANAGHEYPVLYSGSTGKFKLVTDPHDFVVGGLEDSQYHEYELMMKPGDKLFLYTDGVPEAANKDGEFFGVKRLVNALNENPDGGPVEILSEVQDALDQFVDDAEQFDDITMMCLKYNG